MCRYFQIACLVMVALAANALIAFAGIFYYQGLGIWPIAGIGGLLVEYGFVLLLLDKLGVIDIDDDLGYD